jgi:hypothetical protein
MSMKSILPTDGAAVSFGARASTRIGAAGHVLLELGQQRLGHRERDVDRRDPVDG